VELLDEEAIIEKIAYVLANPVTAGLVRRATRWPGETSARLSFGDVVIALRPATAYYRNSRQSARYELVLAAPPGVDPIHCLERVRVRVHQLEKEAAQKMQREGRKWLGERRVLQQDPYDSPSTWEARRGLRPTFASRDKWKRVEASQRRGWFLSAYRSALDRFRSGDRTVTFPHGTWLMERLYGCNCAPAPT
jgi:hypothetical protein